MFKGSSVSKGKNAYGFFENMKKFEQEEKTLVSNYDYINWLEKFSEIHPSFNDNEWLYFPDSIPSEDFEKVVKLCSFWCEIEAYCNKFMIDILVRDEFYVIKRVYIRHNGIGYMIEYIVGQGSYIRVTRRNININYIDFKAIVENIAPQNFDEVKKKFEVLEKLISELKGMNVPMECIMDTVKKYY